MFKAYVVDKCAPLLLFNATLDSLDATRGSEDVLVNRGLVEDTVVVVMDDIDGGGSSHLTLNSLLSTKAKHIFLYQNIVRIE